MGAATTETMTVRVDRSLKTKLEALARSLKRSKSELTAEAIAAYLEVRDWQVQEIETGIAELDQGRAISGDAAEREYERLLKPR